MENILLFLPIVIATVSQSILTQVNNLKKRDYSNFIKFTFPLLIGVLLVILLRNSPVLNLPVIVYNSLGNTIIWGLIAGFSATGGYDFYKELMSKFG